MSPVIVCLGGAVLSAPGLCQDAFTNNLNPLSADTNGIHLYSVYGFAGSFSSPRAGYGGYVPTGLGADMGFGGGASVGWNYLRSGSGVSITYSPSYYAFRKNSALNSLNHGLSVIVHHRRQPGTRWQTGFSVSASVESISQFLFDTPGLAKIAGAPATFDDLAGGIVAGQFTNDQIASLLTGASSSASTPAELVAFGDRFFYAAVQGSVSYAYSPRLAFTASLSGRRYEALPTNSSLGTPIRLIRNNTSGTGSVGFSYSRSSRTQIGGEISTTRLLSRLEDVYSTSATLSVGRLFSRRWFGQLRGGVGVITPVRWYDNLYNGPQFVGGGVFGFKTLAHTLMVSYEQLRHDPYGLGPKTSSSSTLAWNWRSRGNWSASVSGSYFRINEHPLVANSWQGQAALTKFITPHVGFSLRFSALSNPGALIANQTERVLYAGVVAVYWSPGGIKRRKAE